jgi:copper resistance protein D
MGRQSGLFAPDVLRLPCAILTVGMLLTALAYLWPQASIMSGSPLGDAASAVYAVLTQSHFGLAWLVGFTGALLAALSCLHRGRGLWLFAAGLVLWAAGKAAASHAADGGDFSRREAVHVAHLLATTFWAGSVIVAATLRRACPRASGGSSEQCAEFCSCFPISRRPHL